MEYFETLLDDCPPTEAKYPEDKTLYRLCANAPPSSSDFMSQRHIQPNKEWQGVTECRARSVSLFSKTASLVNVMRSAKFKNSTAYIAEVVLNQSDGKIMQTGRNKEHFSWWRSVEFKPEDCRIVQ